MDGMLLFGWGRPHVGREEQAMRVFAEAMELFARMAADGRITGVEPVLLRQHGGGLGGFFLIRGEEAALAELELTDDFLRLVARASLVVADVGVVHGAVGERLQRMMGLFGEQLAELAGPVPAAA